MNGLSQLDGILRLSALERNKRRSRGEEEQKGSTSSFSVGCHDSCRMTAPPAQGAPSPHLPPSPCTMKPLLRLCTFPSVCYPLSMLSSFCLYITYLFITSFLLFISFWLHRVFIAACWLSLVAASGGYSSLRCTGFSLQWLLLLWVTGSRRTGLFAPRLWDHLGPWIEPVSPALAGRFLTTVPPGKSPVFVFKKKLFGLSRINMQKEYS